MALNDIAICSRALIRLGAQPISSFDDGSVESEICGALYAQSRDALLSSYGWSFATGQVDKAYDECYNSYHVEVEKCKLITEKQGKEAGRICYESAAEFLASCQKKIK